MIHVYQNMTVTFAPDETAKLDAWLDSPADWDLLGNPISRRSILSADDIANISYGWHARASLAQQQATEQSRLKAIEAAAEKLVRCKGRYHSELNMIAIAALFGVKLPPARQQATQEAPKRCAGCDIPNGCPEYCRCAPPSPCIAKELSEEQIAMFWGGAVIRHDTTKAQVTDFARAIEAHHGIPGARPLVDEPPPGEQAAWIAGLDEGRAQALASTQEKP